MAKKIYVIDTNVLMDTPDAIYGFDDNVVIITATVLQELDKHKRDAGERGYNARTAIKMLDVLFPEDYGSQINPAFAGHKVLKALDCNDDNGIASKIIRGRSLPGDGLIAFVNSSDKEVESLPPEYDISRPDNMILRTVRTIQSKINGLSSVWGYDCQNRIPVILVTNDVSMRVNARSLGIKAQAYKNVRLDKDITYTGHTQRDCESGDWKEYYKALEKDGVLSLPGKYAEDLHENEYVLMQAGKGKEMIAVYRKGSLLKVDPSKCHPMGVNPRNALQVMAIDALLAPVEEVPLVILEGPAGTAKTFLSVAAGLDQTIRLGRVQTGKYARMIITRNNILADEDHGFLPGDLEDKMFPLLAPFYDNLESLFTSNAEGEDPADIKMQIDDLFENGVIESSSMAYMRGRNLTNTYLILDECQNTTKGQMLTLLTRAAENGKIVIAGCVDQIDNPRIDKYSNGLSHVIERFADSPLAAQVTFTDEEIVRSPLAAEATRLLAD